MKYQFSICRTIATIFIIAFSIFIIATGAGARMFINIPSLVITIGLCFFMMLTVYEIEFLNFIPHAVYIFFCKPLVPNPRYAQIALFGSRSIIGAGLIGMIIGMIRMLSNLSDPSDIGVGMATALTCPFYAIIASEIFFAIVHQSFKQTKGEVKGNNTLPLINAGLPLLIILFSFSIFLILVLSFADIRI